MPAISLPNGFKPRDYQKRLMRYFDTGGKRAACVWHRRAGKDVTALHQACKMAHERVGMYWHCLPTYRQAKKAIWDGFTRDGKKIIDTVFPPEIVRRKNESEMLVELKKGSVVQLVGSDTIDNLVGAGPIHVTFSEFSISKPNAWDLVRPMLAENEGSASFIFTPRGNNHGKKLYELAKKDSRWFCELLTINDTNALPISLLDEERAAGMPEELIRQEYLCDFTAALVGAVWGDLVERMEKSGALESFPYESDGIFTNWDLGISDSTSILAWRISDKGVDIVDHYSGHGKPMSHYFDKLEEWSQTKQYKYVKHWLPHDARARTLQTGVSILEQFMTRFGAGAVAIGPELSLMDGIQAARWLLQQPTKIHGGNCASAIESFKQYHYAYDEDRRNYSKKPEHDWSSHDADALRYLACVVRHSEVMTRKPAPPKRLAAVAPEALTFDAMLEKHIRTRRRGGA